MLENSEADMTTLLAMNDERKDFLSFSHAFGGSGWVFVGRDGESILHSLEQLEGKVLALPARHALEAEIRRDYPAIKLHTTKTYGEARALVESREAYATIENETGVHLYPAGQLQVGRGLEGKWEPDYLAVRQDLSVLLSILNKALEAFPAEDMRALRSKWMAGTTPSRRHRSGSGCPAGVLVRDRGRGFRPPVPAVEPSPADTDRPAPQGRGDPQGPTDAPTGLDGCHSRPDFHPGPGRAPDHVQQKLRRPGCDPLRKAAGHAVDGFGGIPAGHRRVAPWGGDGAIAHRPVSVRRPTIDVQQRIAEIYHWSVPFYGADGQLRGILGGWTDAGRCDKLMA